MKKYTIYFVVIALVIILLNIFCNISIFRSQVAFQRNILSGQAEASAGEIESSLMKFENEVNALLYSNALPKVDISSDEITQDGLRSLEMLLTNNSDLIKNVHIYDNNKNVLNLSFNKRKRLLIDPFVTQHQNELQDREIVIKSDEDYTYTFPVFKDSHLVANMAFTLDLPGYFQSVFNHYHHNGDFWQWMADNQGKVVFSNALSPVILEQSDFLKSTIERELSGFSKHSVLYDKKSEQLYSAFTPLNILNEKFGIVFSMRKNFVFDLILHRVIISGILNIILLLLFLSLLYGKLRKNLSVNEKESVELTTLQSIFDNLPVGIMVLDQNQDILILNQTAREMLLLRQDEQVSGKGLTDRFMLSKDYYDSNEESAFDSNQFVLYRHEGEEVAVYKKDLPFILREEEYLLSAFVDVTPLEKARKYEAAANTAKSEFLAKMSHEIRTPMNGIIGMTEALGQENLTPNQKDYVQIVKRSADVLLTLIDDILDFSKIEAGKMQLEEIPFKLREEVKFAVDIFRPIIQEKNLELNLRIHPRVPENIIGDPFRLRQVLTNLISNAVKFTHEGEIAVGVELEEEYNHNLTLLFYVEDTGVGIPRNKIESIFNSFTQAEESTSRKYGGSGLGTTIAKQLVTLMHGEISVQSPSPISRTPNYPGSRFSFTIEVYSNEKLLKSVHTEKIHNLSQLQALIITSTPDNKHRLIRLFEHEKIKAEFFTYNAGKTSELLQKLNESIGIFPVLFILDDNVLNGFQLAKKLKEDKLSDSYLIFLISSNHKSENYILAKRHGIDYYLIEPFEHPDLVNSIYESFPHVEKVSGEIVRKLKSDLRILVAEDNEINIRVAQTIFSNLGYKIDIARNGNEAVEKVGLNVYDIVFMDLVMPGRDGIQATVEIRGLGHVMPIVAMTATASTKSKIKAIASGMNDYIVKPVKIDSIRSLLIKWFA
ncbi:MAG: response regulator [Bacteroidales bacterium]|nr:response regulator [Bacteroidales bacterium]